MKPCGCAIAGRQLTPPIGYCPLHNAAPALLEALQKLTTRFVDMIESGDCGQWQPSAEPTVSAAIAAIAKAEGRL